MSQNPKTIKLGLALDAFLLDCQARRLRAQSVKFYRNQLRRFLAYLPCENLQDVTPHLIRSYLVNLEGQGLKPASIHAAARSMRAFFNFAV
ncbi:MAG: site-specific integrase [Caldilineaceae bacterium]|nr:site-specific integrase [Caldilineaceae bacterium]